MRLFSLSSCGRVRLCGCLAAVACVLGLMAQQASAATPTFVQSAAPLGFPGNAMVGGGNWYLYGTACDGSRSCVLVGYYGDSSGHNQAYVVPVTDGVQGTPEEVTLPGDADANPNAMLYGVSCGASGICEAYGVYNSAGVPTPLVVKITNGVPDPAVEVGTPDDVRNNSYFYVNGISCTSASDCVAVGDYQNVSTSPLPVAVPIIDGVPQSPVTPRLPHDQASTPNAVLNSVACQSTGTCAAVGYYRDSSGDVRGLVVPINAEVVGVGVAVDPADSGSNPDGDLVYAACPASGACQAVGSYFNSAGLSENMVVPIVDGLPGTASPVMPPAGPYSGNNASVAVQGLDCSSPVLCVAAGTYTDSSGVAGPAVISIKPTGATIQQTSLPADADPVNPDAQFYAGTNGSAVGCAPSGPCLASGFYGLGHNGQSDAGLVQPIGADGTIATALEAPAPGDISSAGPSGYGPQALLYFGVGCVASGSCVTAGEYQSAAHGLEPYLVTEQTPLSVTSDRLAAASEGAAYQSKLTAAGAWGAYSWAISAGSLPAGLSLDSQTGVISGTPSGSGTSTFSVQARGTGSPVQTAIQSLSIAVTARMSTSTPTSATTTPATPPPAPRVVIVGARGKLVKHRVGVSLSCVTAACDGTVALQASRIVTSKHGTKRVRRPETVIVGTASFSLAAGAGDSLNVAVNALGRRLLATARSHHLAVKIVATALGVSSASRELTIYAAKR